MKLVPEHLRHPKQKHPKTPPSPTFRMTSSAQHPHCRYTPFSHREGPYGGFVGVKTSPKLSVAIRRKDQFPTPCFTTQPLLNQSHIFLELLKDCRCCETQEEAVLSLAIRSLFMIISRLAPILKLHGCINTTEGKHIRYDSPTRYTSR